MEEQKLLTQFTTPMTLVNPYYRHESPTSQFRVIVKHASLQQGVGLHNHIILLLQWCTELIEKTPLSNIQHGKIQNDCQVRLY